MKFNKVDARKLFKETVEIFENASMEAKMTYLEELASSFGCECEIYTYDMDDFDEDGEE